MPFTITRVRITDKRRTFGINQLLLSSSIVGKKNKKERDKKEENRRETQTHKKKSLKFASLVSFFVIQSAGERGNEVLKRRFFALL